MSEHPLGTHHVHHLTHFSEIARVNWTHCIRGVAWAMVGVLVPIYLLKLGYEIPEIAVFFLIEGLAWTVFIYPSMWMIHRFGGNRTMAWATLLSVAYFWGLATLPSHQLLWVPAVLWGLAVAPYWYALRATFASAMTTEKSGSEVGLAAALYLAALGIAPALGGIIGSTVGMVITYIFAVGLSIVAMVPLLRSPDPIPTRPPDLRKNLRIRAYWRDYAANAFATVDDAVQGFVWPLLVFFVIPSYAGVGLASSVITIAMIMISLYVGKQEGAKGELHYIREGSTLLALVSAARLLISNVVHVFGINFFYGISRALIDTSYTTAYYKNARRRPTLEYVFGMQVASALGWIAAVGILCVALALLPTETALLVGLATMIPASLGVRLIR